MQKLLNSAPKQIAEVSKHRPNALSAFGRISFGTHLLIYPALVYLGFGVFKPWMAKRSKAAKEKEIEAMPKAKKVDPLIFNAYTPIPFHNNYQVKYAHANLDMFEYVNENHINVKRYPYKLYHNVYDHDNKNEYLYNWVSVHGPNH